MDNALLLSETQNKNILENKNFVTIILASSFEFPNLIKDFKMEGDRTPCKKADILAFIAMATDSMNH